jgi:ABC-type transport system involved in multi-copper enzyme maturation permease subunit
VRLLQAELLKLRRRMATYVVLGVLLVIMALIYLAVAASGETGMPGSDPARFPEAYATIGTFVFGLGSLLAVVYAAAVAGADWNWGVLSNVISRGESRVRYILAKAAALAIVFAIGVLIAYAVGIVLVYLAAAMRGTSVGDPLAPRSLRHLVDYVVLGYPVLLERAAIGFAIAVLLKSQLAGVIVGIVLYVGEGILAGIMLTIALFANFGQGGGLFGIDPIGPEWYQFLPFSIGDSLMTAAAPATSFERGMAELILRPVPVDLALAFVLAYMAGALLLSVFVVQRQEITS